MYLIYSDSFWLMKEEINKITGTNTNVVTLDLATLSLEEVLNEASYVSMFPEKKYIIVKNVSLFGTKKVDEKELERFYEYMEHPSEMAVLLFTTYEKIDLRKKITKTFKEKYTIISAANLSADELFKRMNQWIKKNKYTISTESLQYILRSCRNNYDLIYNEINKIFLYYQNPQEIKEEDVKEIVSRFMEDNNFRFVEAVIEKKYKTALHILEDLYALKVDPIALLLLLAREYRLMYSVLILMENGYPKVKICKELNLADWQVDKLNRHSFKYTKDQLAAYIKKLSEIDYKIKKGDQDKFMALKSFLTFLED